MSVIHRSENSSTVLVVGDIVLDRYWFGDVSRISPEAPIPIVLVKQVEERLGGAANVANNISALGTPVLLLGVVGNDSTATEIYRLAKQTGITTHFIHDEAMWSNVKLRVLGHKQQMLRVDVDESPAPEVMEAQLDAFDKLMPAAGIVVLSGRGGALTEAGRMISAARREGKTILVDPKGTDYKPYTGASIITPNRVELAEVVGRWRDEADLTGRAQKLREELQCSALLLTRSEEGMTLFTRDEVWHVPAKPREIYDVSGAGDTVVATLAAMLAEGKPLKEAVALANVAAGIVVDKIGTATVTREELFLQR
jgi:rfaE bifunctional protein kinase chain/domain